MTGDRAAGHAGVANKGAASAGTAEPEMPFRVRDEETIWVARPFRVCVARVEGPDGEALTRDVVHHRGAVAAVPLHEDGTVTLVHQYRVALDRGIWEIPAGLRDVDGEPTETTARRELAEEVGLSGGQMSHLATFHNSPGFCDEEVQIFLATDLTAVPDDRQGPEEKHMVVERMPLSDALEMVDDGRITDSKTVIGLLRTRDRLAT